MTDLVKIKYKVVDGTSYNEETPDIVVAILERSRREQLRLVITYGDVKTGKAWNDAGPNRGHVGRSTGENKIPLLVKTSRSLGGEALLDSCIVKITEARSGRVLYQWTP